MKLPRNLSSDDLIKSLSSFGYEVTRQTGSHIRLTTQNNGEHHLTIPAHHPIKIGTLNNILKSITEHFQISRDELLKKIF